MEVYNTLGEVQVDDDDVGPARGGVSGVRPAGSQVRQSVGAGEHQPRRASGIGSASVVPDAHLTHTVSVTHTVAAGGVLD